MGWSITDVAKDLLTFADKSVNARSDDDIDIAACAFARAVVNGGLTAVMALLLRKSTRNIQATRGSSIYQVARPRNPGLVQVGADSQANQLWRRPFIRGDASLAVGTGETTAFGDVTYSTAGSATEQQLAKIHELVHSFLSPRFRVLRTFRARLAMSGYMRSSILKYFEEALAESVAQLAAFGVVGLLEEVTFPISNGYITLQQLAVEGAEIGKIVVGTQRFSVQYIVTGPSLTFTP